MSKMDLLKHIQKKEAKIKKAERERDDYKERYDYQCELKYALQDNEEKLEATIERIKELHWKWQGDGQKWADELEAALEGAGE